MRRLRSLPFFLLATLALVLVPGAGATGINPAALPSGTTDTAYNQTLTGTGGTGPYTFALSAGALPPGLTINASGDITGTPTSSGDFSFTITATDSAGPPVAGSRAYVLTISPAVLTITPNSLLPGSRGYFQEDQLDASGGTAPYSFAVTAGVLPAGITLAADGYLSGTPAASGSYTFTVRVTDAHSSTGFRTYTLNINIQTLNIDPPTLDDATAGVAYVEQLDGTGGVGPYTFAVGAGSTLPPGLTLAPNGALTGNPSKGGTYSFGVKVTDSVGATMTRTFVLRVTLFPLTVSASLGGGAYATPYDQFFSSSGGTAPYAYTLASGGLPPGLTLSTTGELYGSPTAYGVFSFMVTSVDKYGDTGTFPFTMSIAGPQILMTPDDLFAATSGLFYSAKMNATGGVGTFTYTLASGMLPAGLTLAADGSISGIPNAAPGLFSFTVRATDSNLAAGSKSMTLKLETPMMLVDSVSLPLSTIGVAYRQVLSVTGGTAPYTYSLVDGVVPTGLVLSADGVLSGSSRTAGTSLFTVLIVDANGNKSRQSFRIVVEKSTLTVVKKKPVKKKAKAKTKKH